MYSKTLCDNNFLHIIVVGSGGTGSHLLRNLAAMVYAKEKMNNAKYADVYVYDDDYVEPHNVGRQCFSVADIGYSKSLIEVSNINMAYGFNWKYVNKRFDALELETQQIPNMIISCVDNVITRKKIDKIVKTSNLFWVDFGNERNTGQVVISNSELPSIFDMYKKIEEKPDEPTCSMIESLLKQDLFVNQTLANLGSHMIWKLLTDKEIHYNALWMNLNTLTINKNKL